MYLLVSGRVKVSLASPEGKELVLNYLEAPAHFGEMSLVDAQPRTADVIAVTDVEVLLARRPGPLGGDPAPAASRAVPHRDALAAPAQHDRPARGHGVPRRDAPRDARGAQRRHRGLETRGAPVVQGMTHYDIATLAGTSRETASRVISQLAREGIVVPEGAATDRRSRSTE